MAHKYFSSDFHFGFESLLKLDSWPFKSIEKHDAALIRSCKERAKPEDVKIYDKEAFKVTIKQWREKVVSSLS